VTERQWTDNVLELCRLFGWHAVHMIPLRTKHGWRTGVQGNGAIGWLKCGRANKPTREQSHWLELLARCGCETFVWYPDDVDQVAEVLR
jgi:hypothetical protein